MPLRMERSLTDLSLISSKSATKWKGGGQQGEHPPLSLMLKFNEPLQKHEADTLSGFQRCSQRDR